MRAVIALAAVALAGSGEWTAPFGDRAGDGNGAPDITSLSVGSSDSGNVSFGLYVHIPSSDTSTVLTVFVDADSNRATGDPATGAEYAFRAEHGGRDVSFMQWTGSWVRLESPTATGAYLAGSTLGLGAARSDLGDATAIDVVAESRKGSAVDRIPDTGSIHYNLRPLVLKVVKFAASRGPLSERVQLKIRRSDNGAALEGILPDCTARVAGGVLSSRSFSSAKSGKPAFCEWHFPSALRGRRATATIRIPFGGRTVARTVRFTVH
jgi:hypothetical protein